MKEIIVYLDDHSTISTKGISELWLDFRSCDDLNLFTESLNGQELFVDDYRQIPECILNDEVLLDSSYIHISNCKLTKRLRTGYYYALNIDCLRKGRVQYNQDNPVSLLTFDFAQVDGPLCNSLLKHHGPLEPLKIESISVEDFDGVIPCDVDWNQLRLTVADVGQANLNIISHKDTPFIVFDAGAPFNSNKSFIHSIIRTYLNNIHNCTLVISHWDIDHYKCLKLLTDKQLSSMFLQVICTDQTKSLTSQIILNRLRNALGTRVLCITPPDRMHPSPYSSVVQLDSNGFISLYIGEYSSNINYCGISAMIDGSNYSVLLTGDCMLAQADDILTVNYPQFNKNHILVVPHHGGSVGNIGYRYNSRGTITPSGAVVSVGANNEYGHPNPSTMSYLSKVFNGHFHLTSLSGIFSMDI